VSDKMVSYYCNMNIYFTYSSSDHGKSAIVQLLGLHVSEVLSILGLEAEGVKTNVTCRFEEAHGIRG
jgi:hypothetical protein